MLRGLGVDTHLETWVGNLVLAFYVLSFLMNPIWGGIADHYGRKIMVERSPSVYAGQFGIAALSGLPVRANVAQVAHIRRESS